TRPPSVFHRYCVRGPFQRNFQPERVARPCVRPVKAPATCPMVGQGGNRRGNGASFRHVPQRQIVPLEDNTIKPGGGHRPVERARRRETKGPRGPAAALQEDGRGRTGGRIATETGGRACAS